MVWQDEDIPLMAPSADIFSLLRSPDRTRQEGAKRSEGKRNDGSILEEGLSVSGQNRAAPGIGIGNGK